MNEERSISVVFKPCLALRPDIHDERAKFSFLFYLLGVIFLKRSSSGFSFFYDCTLEAIDSE
jgi:hypothetical protein